MSEAKLTVNRLDHATGYEVAENPKPTGGFRVFGNTVMAVYGKPPNRFHRLMMRLAFGWKWEPRDE